MAYYVQLDADYWDHPKTLHLVALMGPRGETVPLKMWSWAARFKKSGVFDSTLQLAQACRYRGKPDQLQDALRTAGFLDADGLTIHDWKERTGAGIAMYEREKERQRLKAERNRTKGDTAGGTEVSTPVRTPGEYPVSTTITGPDRTGPDLNNQSPPPPRGRASRSRAGAGRKQSLDQVLTEAIQEGKAHERPGK